MSQGAHPSIKLIKEIDLDSLKGKYSDKHIALLKLIKDNDISCDQEAPFFNKRSLGIDAGILGTITCDGIDIIKNGWLTTKVGVLKKLFSDFPNAIDDLEKLSKNEIHLKISEAYIDTIDEHKNKYYTPSTIIREMCDIGIGRPSTYASSLKKIFDKDTNNYISFDNSYIKITPTGKFVYETLKELESPIADHKYTAELENALDRLESGKEPASSILGKFLKNIINIPHTGLDLTWIDKISSLPEVIEQDIKTEQKQTAKLKTTKITKVELPDNLNPEKTLSPFHPLRILKDSIDKKIDIVGHDKIFSKELISKRKIYRAIAFYKHLKFQSVTDFIERMNHDILLRWFVGFDLDSTIWSERFFEENLMNIQESFSLDE